MSSDFAMVRRLPNGFVLIMVRGDDAGGATNYHGRPFPPEEARAIAAEIIEAAGAPATP